MMAFSEGIQPAHHPCHTPTQCSTHPSTVLNQPLFLLNTEHQQLRSPSLKYTLLLSLPLVTYTLPCLLKNADHFCPAVRSTAPSTAGSSVRASSFSSLPHNGICPEFMGSVDSATHSLTTRIQPLYCLSTILKWHTQGPAKSSQLSLCPGWSGLSPHLCHLLYGFSST